MTNPDSSAARPPRRDPRPPQGAALLCWDQQDDDAPRRRRGARRAGRDARRMAHELFVADETGRLLDELRSYEDSLDPDSVEASLIRVTRRDYEKAVRVPADLRAEMSRAGVAGYAGVGARRRPRRTSALPARARAEPRPAVPVRRLLRPGRRAVRRAPRRLRAGMKTAEVRADLRRAQGGARAADPPSVERPRRSTRSAEGDFPIDAQRELSLEVLELFGLRPDAWRLDPTAAPVRLRRRRRRHPDHDALRGGDLDSLFATMHEYGHGLYEHQVGPELDRSPLASGVSLGLHESQSRMWENLVGRSLPFWRGFYPRLQERSPGSSAASSSSVLPRGQPACSRR